jgi:hypothetical protein
VEGARKDDLPTAREGENADEVRSTEAKEATAKKVRAIIVTLVVSNFEEEDDI